MWRGFTFGEELLFSFGVERSHSSHFMWRGVTLQIRRGVTLHICCGEESLFTLHVEESHSSQLMWIGVTLYI
jgi:hypothetical protein